MAYRLAANMGVDLPAVATWCEKALPFLLLLLCTFIYRHIQGGVLTESVGATWHVFAVSLFGQALTKLRPLQGLQHIFGST